MSAETFSETWAAAVVTVSMFSSWVFDDATSVAVSSSTGTVWSVISLTEVRVSSSTRPSLISGTAKKPTSSTNASAAISPATSPTDMSSLLVLGSSTPPKPYPPRTHERPAAQVRGGASGRRSDQRA